MHNGLVTSNGSEHKLRYKISKPIFYPEYLQRYLPVINSKTKSFLQQFDVNLSENEIDIFEDILDFSLDLSLASFFGVSNSTYEQRQKLNDDIKT